MNIISILVGAFLLSAAVTFLALLNALLGAIDMETLDGSSGVSSE